jgi:hypothetical protein
MAKAKAKAKDLKIKILQPVAGKYLLSANVGDEITLDVDQANELIENKFAEFVK